ncbi:MAG: tetratricopeptide repeat protein [Candidatus Delongbacteria bacterium]
MKKIILFALILLTCTLVANDQILLKDSLVSLSCKGISFIGSGITVDDAKMFAVNDAKRNALEKVGTYLESHMEMKDHVVTKDEILTYTAGILESEIISAENKLVDGTFAIEVKINASIDTKYLKERLKRIRKDSQLRKMLEEQKKLNDKLTKEIFELKKQKTGYAEKSKNIARSLKASDWFNKGYRAQENGEYEKALEYYTKAIRLDPTIAQIYNNRGLVHYFMQDYPRAEVNFDKAIELDNELCMAYNNKAIIYYERRLYDQAISYFNKVIELDPTLAQPYYNRAFSYHKKGRTDLSIEDLITYVAKAGNKYGDRQRILNFIKENEDTEDDEEKEPEPQMITVPDLYNMTPSAAKKRIADSGLVLGMVKSVTDINRGFDRVIGQSLEKGSRVEQSSVIDITVNEEAALGW